MLYKYMYVPMHMYVYLSLSVPLLLSPPSPSLSLSLSLSFPLSSSFLLAFSLSSPKAEKLIEYILIFSTLPDLSCLAQRIISRMLHNYSTYAHTYKYMYKHYPKHYPNQTQLLLAVFLTLRRSAECGLFSGSFSRH